MKFVINKNIKLNYMSSIMVLVIACLLLISNLGLLAPDTLLAVNITAILIAVPMVVYTFLSHAQQNKAKQKEREQTVGYCQQLELQVTELNIAKDKLSDQKNMEKFASAGRMARMIAHEVRNPLTNIGLANDQLKDAVEINEENTMLIGMIKRNGERINNLIGELLNATKFIELNCCPFFINNLLDEVLVELNKNAVLQYIDVQKNYLPSIGKVLVDDIKIKTAFYNLIVNAAEFLLLKGTAILHITTCDVNNQCRIIIKNNGVGMDEESIAKLFEPFSNKKKDNDGLGLTTAQNIILNHKGAINVTSYPGKGTSFIVSLNYA